MERTTKYILVNLVGVLFLVTELLLTHNLGGFGLGLIIGSNLLFR
jgi:hypothetical protein